jgi:Helix-turn-helix domain
MEDQSATVTVKDAMRLTGYSLRQIDRFIEAGELEVVNHQPGRQRKISRASIDAFNKAHGFRLVDEVDVLKEEHLKHKQVTGEVLVELAEIRTQFKEFQGWVKRKTAELEDWFHAQTGQRSQRSAPAVPDGTIMLVEFAKRHDVSKGTLRGVVERDSTLVTVIPRPGAKEKKRKWMITPAQMAPLLAALGQHGIAYTPCAQCPHEERD